RAGRQTGEDEDEGALLHDRNVDPRAASRQGSHATTLSSVIRFDDAARAVTLSVRDIADAGDYRFSGPMAVGLRKRAAMGREAHESHQGAREEAVASYRRERSLRYETEVEGWRVVVVGRIDGVFTDPQGRTVIEEVKTVLAAPDALERMDEQTYPHYARQLQLYRYLLEEGARALGFDELRGAAP